MATFSQAGEIIEAGLEEGRKFYPQFKKLADSLNALYGTVNGDKELPDVHSVKISSFEVNGLKFTTKDFFIHTTGLLTNHVYTPEMLAHMVRRAGGTRYYNRINYQLDPQPDHSAKIVFDVSERNVENDFCRMIRLGIQLIIDPVIISCSTGPAHHMGQHFRCVHMVSQQAGCMYKKILCGKFESIYFEGGNFYAVYIR